MRLAAENSDNPSKETTERNESSHYIPSCKQQMAFNDMQIKRRCVVPTHSCAHSRASSEPCQA